MLEELSPEEFEAWCKVLLERTYNCSVEDLPFVADEGRDLIVHHPDGKIIVECKHQPNSSIGRPVVQKLHSAIITAGARKGIMMTTGRFSKAAMDYARALDVEIDFIDGSRLSYMAEQTGLSPGSSHLDDKTALAIRTCSDAEFVQIFSAKIFVEPRYNPGRGYEIFPSVNRATHYEGVFLAEFSAYGELRTAVGVASASWQGLVWVSLDGSRFGVEEPDSGVKSAELVPLGEAIKATPGPSQPPSIQPHEAASKIKEHLLQALSKTVTYTGQNNVTYTRDVKPGARSTNVKNVRLVYKPKQSFTLQIGQTIHAGQVREHQKQFLVFSQSLSTCCICQRAVTERNQIFCAICHRPAHTRTFLTPDSFRCNRCNATLCYEHSLRNGQETACPRCSSIGRKPQKRWLPHLALGLSLTLLLALSGLPRLHGGYAFLGLILSWLPFAYVAKKGNRKGSKNWLVY